MITITMAGLALMRLVGTGLIIAGNLAFRQSATGAADLGVEASKILLTSFTTPEGINFLQGNTATVSGVEIKGYYPAWCYTALDQTGSCATTDNFDPTTFDWNNTDLSRLATGPSAGAGNTVRYVVHRLCATRGSTIEATDPALTQACVLASVTCDNKGIGECFKISSQPYYRVTARVSGPRNTLSYVEVILF
jgi:hypothetical protein